MIFFYHLLILASSSLGLGLAYWITGKTKVKRHVIFLILFLGIGLLIHFVVDSMTSSREDFIRYYINLEPHPDLTLDFLYSKIIETSQYPFISD